MKQRCAQLMQAGIGQLHLRLYPDRPHHCQIRRRLDHVLEQGRLPNPSLAPQNQRPTLATAQPRPGRRAAHTHSPGRAGQHPPAMGEHGSPSATSHATPCRPYKTEGLSAASQTVRISRRAGRLRLLPCASDSRAPVSTNCRCGRFATAPTAARHTPAWHTPAWPSKAQCSRRRTLSQSSSAAGVRPLAVVHRH